MKVSAACAALISMAALGACVAAQDAPVKPPVVAEAPDPILAFDKRVEMIPMRDGVRLYTEIYAPRQQQELPIMLVRTPYGVTRMTKVGPPGSVFNRGYRELAADGYIFVFQDIRGRQSSEGRFEMVRKPRHRGDAKATDESTDAYDTIDWVLRHTQGHNGRVGMMGISYPAWLTMMAAIDPHPALRAISPQASPADVYIGDDFFHNGAFRLSYGFEYVALMQRGAGNNLFEFDAYDSFEWYLRLGGLGQVSERYFKGHDTAWRDFIEHPNYDAYWRERAVVPRLGRASIPALTVGGWFDQEDGYGPLAIYAAWRRDDPERNSHLVLGPWNHGGWSEGAGRALGEIDFGSATAEFFRKDVLVPWFGYHLKGRGSAPQARVLAFETGGNAWHRMQDWPPNEGTSPRKLYLRASGKLAFEPPPEGEDDAFDQYVSDPARPVPYRARPVESTFGFLKGGKEGWQDWLVADQRFVHARPDVSSWTTEPLEHDLVLAGDVVAHLFAATTGSDSDWVVKLIDVHPDLHPQRPELGGFQQMVTAEILRGRYRKSFERPQPIMPNAVERYSIDLHQRLHRFRKGHRIMVQVQSTWFPLYDRNPQQFVENIFLARNEDFRAATQSIYRSHRYPSHVQISVQE